MSEAYRVNEIFYSLQGEGMRAGTANVFVRFSGCNMRCDIKPGPRSPGGWACDTEFASGTDMTLEKIHLAAAEAMGVDNFFATANEDVLKWQVLTGGEPGLQVDREYCDYMHLKGWLLAIETNGSVRLPANRSATQIMDRNESEGNDWREYVDTGDFLLDWITVSPKVPEHAVRQLVAHEVKYVRGYGQALPQPRCEAQHQLISPAFDGPEVNPATLAWCVVLVKRDPQWRLSVQQHKSWAVR